MQREAVRVQQPDGSFKVIFRETPGNMKDQEKKIQEQVTEKPESKGKPRKEKDLSHEGYRGLKKVQGGDQEMTEIWMDDFPFYPGKKIKLYTYVFNRKNGSTLYFESAFLIFRLMCGSL